MAAALNATQHRQICDELQDLTPRLIYLFGSMAHGDLRPDSDVDIAILADRELDVVRLFERAQELARSLRRSVDLVDLRGTTDVLAKEVVATGVVLYAADESFRRQYEGQVLRRYAQLNEDRRPVLKVMES